MKEKFLLAISTLLVIAKIVLWFWNWSNENWNSKGSKMSIWKINLLIRSFHKWTFQKTIGKYHLQNSSPTNMQHLWHCSELTCWKHIHLQRKTWFWSGKKRFKVILKIRNLKTKIMWRSHILCFLNFFVNKWQYLQSEKPPERSNLMTIILTNIARVNLNTLKPKRKSCSCLYFNGCTLTKVGTKMYLS